MAKELHQITIDEAIHAQVIALNPEEREWLRVRACLACDFGPECSHPQASHSRDDEGRPVCLDHRDRVWEEHQERRRQQWQQAREEAITQERHQHQMLITLKLQEIDRVKALPMPEPTTWLETYEVRKTRKSGRVDVYHYYRVFWDDPCYKNQRSRHVPRKQEEQVIRCYNNRAHLKKLYQDLDRLVDRMPISPIGE